MGKDCFAALHEVAYMLPTFVWSIVSFPDITLCCGLQQLIDLVATESIRAQLSYDTTFCLGNFYVSVLVLKCTAFNENPIIPIAFVIHERKFESVHAQFFTLLKGKMSAVSKIPCTIVTDGEVAITKAVINTMPNWNLVACWNHILRDVEMWLKKRHTNATEIAVYKSHIRELLQSETAVAMALKLQTVRTSWSQAFSDYYDNQLHERLIVGYSGYLLDCGLDREGITTNASESLNAMLKRFQVNKKR